MAPGPTAANTGSLVGTLVDADDGTPVAGAGVHATAAGQAAVGTTSDSLGRYRLLVLPAGTWAIRARAMGYADADGVAAVSPDGTTRLDLRLQPHPLLLDEVVIRARADVGRRTTALVERVDVESMRAPGTDVARVLEGATGVDIRRYGGLGAFSSLSIRGSTSEQVLVYLDGVPLNRAAGGGVDLGSLPVGGIESVDVYRGAVPGRFGGNSLGGVVHMRTVAAGGDARLRLRAQAGSFASRQLSAIWGGRWHRWDALALLDYTGSDNDFRFWDDNGTEYNAADDEWATRRNSDVRAGRILLKIAGPLGASRLLLSHTQDLSHRGVPGIGNYQALQTRYDTWRGVTEANLFGAFGGGAHGYRLKAYHAREQGDYKDLRGEVGTGSQHERSVTDGVGLHGELTQLWRQLLATLYGDARHERFRTADRLEPAAPSPASRRTGGTVGAELEPQGLGRLQLRLGGQVERLADTFVDPELLPSGALRPASRHRETLWSLQLGVGGDLGAGWTVRAQAGRHARAPSFYELFGDRGAVFGNSDLVPEHGRSVDAGLLYRGPDADTGVTLAEAVVYDNRVRDMIRFVQNAQRVSRHNIGRAHLRGLETRVRARAHVVQPISLSAGYTWQHAENRSPFSYERGNELPHAPAHKLRGRVAVGPQRLRLSYEASHESRHFLDRANLRPVPARPIHGIGLRARLARSLSLSVEVRNLTDNQVADLWGYPLPGRSLFVALDIDTLTPSP